MAFWAVLVVLPTTALEGQTSAANPPVDLIALNGGKFLYGTYYYPDHWPEEMWEKDAQMMQAAGINLIKTGEGAWGTFEPSEGQFDFAWMDRAIKLFAAHGIKVILGTPSYSPPAWLYAKYPDVGSVDIHGVRYRFGQRQVQNLSSRHYVDAVKRIVAAEGEHYANNPNVIAFSIDNEIGGQFSYDDLTRADFNEWLKKKYGTIQNVSKAWGGAFWGMELSAWDQVPIPWNDETPNPSMALDFRRFHSDLTDDFMAMQADILRKTAPSKATTHNGMGMYDDVDYSKLFGPLSFAAWDHYPPYASQTFADYFSGDIGNDLTRGSKRQNFMVMEQMMGMGAWDKYFTMNPDPPLYRTWSYQAIAHGADAINYYRWRQSWFGTEQLSIFILNWDSYAGDRYKVVAQMGNELPKITKLLQGSSVVSDVALLVSPDSRWSFRIQPHTSKFSYDALVNDYYKALRQMQTNVDLVFPQQDFSHYKVIVAPALLVVDRDLGARLTDFVKNGGTLVLTFLAGYKDQNNWDTQATLPGFLKQATGAAVHDFDPQIEQKQEIVMSDGSHYPAEIWYDILTPEGAETLATYSNRYYKGQAAITRNHYGKGTTYYVGTKTSDEKFYQKIMSLALTDAGMKPGEIVPYGVQIATREKAGKKICFVLNYEDKTKTVSMGKRMVNAFTGQEEPETVQIGPYDVKVLTAP
jgi:beta-galactosidase